MLGALIDPSLAESFPARPIRIIVPNPAGSGQDVEVRQLITHVAGELGVPVVVENRSGGAQLLGMNLVAKATPDGYTLGPARSAISRRTRGSSTVRTTTPTASSPA